MASTHLDATSTPYYLPFTPNWARHDEPDGDGGGDDTGDDTGGTGDGAVEPPEPAAKPTTPNAPAKKAAAKPASDDGDTAADLGDAGKRALAQERERRKALTAEVAAERAAREAAEKKIQEFEDAQKSELEKAQAAAERAVAREKAANLRAVSSDIRSYAITGDALDPSDVVDALSRRAEDFLTDGGVDAAAIEAAVTELLDKKPHWRKPAHADPSTEGQPAAKKRATPAPAPDPGQGSKGGNNAPNWADPKTFEAEARRLGLPTYR